MPQIVAKDATMCLGCPIQAQKISSGNHILNSAGEYLTLRHKPSFEGRKMLVRMAFWLYGVSWLLAIIIDPSGAFTLVY